VTLEKLTSKEVNAFLDQYTSTGATAKMSMEEMRLRFNRETHAVAESDLSSLETIQTTTNSSISVLIADIMHRNHILDDPAHRALFAVFNDLSHYLVLRFPPGCSKVEICRVRIRHSLRYVMGIEVVYRSTFAGFLRYRKETESTENFFETGYYAYHGGQPRTSELIMADGEYIAEVRTREGEITDQLTFITNKRTVSFGGTGGSEDTVSSQPPDLTRRVVAFVGTTNGVLHRLGVVSIKRNWEDLGPIVLLRTLIERRRASPRQNDDSWSEEDASIRALFVNLDTDLFRRTLSFLAPGIDV